MKYYMIKKNYIQKKNNTQMRNIIFNKKKHYCAFQYNSIHILNSYIPFKDIEINV